PNRLQIQRRDGVVGHYDDLISGQVTCQEFAVVQQRVADVDRVTARAEVDGQGPHSDSTAAAGSCCSAAMIRLTADWPDSVPVSTVKSAISEYNGSRSANSSCSFCRGSPVCSSGRLVSL